MTKKNGQKVPGGPGQKHLHSRVSYLFQAATFLANARVKLQPDSDDPSHVMNRTGESVDNNKHSNDNVPEKATSIDGPNNPTLSCKILAQARAISQKSQIRLTPAMKKSICKRCNVILTPGSSAITRMENHSRNGKKPWADVLVVTCAVCQTAKRYPIGVNHQVKKRDRSSTTMINSSKTVHKITNPVSMDT